MQSSQWMGKGSPRPKKARMSRSKIKVLLVVFFDWKGTVHHEFVPRGQMVNKQLYQEVLACLRDAVCRRRPELWENQTWMLHHDNVLAHVSLLIRSRLDVAPRQCAGSRVAPHPQLSGKTRLGCCTTTMCWLTCPSSSAVVWMLHHNNVLAHVSLLIRSRLDVAPRQCAGSRVAPHPQSSGCCTTTMRWLTCRSSSAVVWQNIRHPLCPIHPILRT